MTDTNATVQFNDTFERLRELLVEHLGVEEGKVTPEATLKDLGADSLDTVDVFMDAEEKFGTGEIPDADMKNFTNVQSVVDYIDARRTK